MLPLWIIDITNQPGRQVYEAKQVSSERQKRFVELIRKIDHVLIPDPTERIDIDAILAEIGSDDDLVGEESPSEGEYGSSEEYINAEKEDETQPKEIGDVLTTKEIIELFERRAAERNAIIKGNYWYYTRMTNYFIGVDHNDAKVVAQRLYDFQSDLVKEGQQFIHWIRQSNVKPYQTINILVLGDTTEDLTRIVFPSIAAILQKEKGRILPHHIHQGMEIMGMLFVPCNINTLSVTARKEIQRTLNEIQVQHEISSIRGYDHMLLYQDVQNRTECTYTLLSPKEQAEYLLQCIVHLFLACDKTHPLISGTSSADDFYLSMGAASVYFDMSIEDEKERILIENNLIHNFKEKGDGEKPSDLSPMISKYDFSPYTYFQDLMPESINLEEADIEDPNPHPIKDFFVKHLKRYYYNHYLRLFPANFYHKTVAKVEDSTRSHLDRIASESKRKYTDSEKRLLPLIGQKLTNINANDGGLPHIVNSLKEMQAILSKNREEIRPFLNFHYWKKVHKEMEETPLDDPFTDYHDMYIHDISAKNQGSGCETMKNEAKNALHELLSRETTVLGAIARCMLGGIVSVLSLYPIFLFIAPLFHLYHADKQWYIWATLIFFIPTLIHLIKYAIYTNKKYKLITVLKAYYLHDAYARIANRIDSEINVFYDKMIALCDAYINRCNLIRKEVLGQKDKQMPKSEIPTTKFNQPLLGGSFGDIELLPAEKNEDLLLKINYIPKKVNELGKSDYFLLINQFHNDFEILFKGIYLTENFMYRVDGETGDEVLVTKEEQEKEIAENWEANKALFRRELRASIKSAVVPRQNATIGDRLLAFTRNTGVNNILETIVNFAASNGEITSSADTEYADIKTNREEIQGISRMFLPVANTKYQIEKFDAIYQKYIFVTRWRSFEHFSFNRILPTEDFDEKIHSLRVSDYEINDEPSENTMPISSIALWAMCPDDTSDSEWIRLFGIDFEAASQSRKTYKKILNQKD